jgi:hypothetical protein
MRDAVIVDAVRTPLAKGPVLMLTGLRPATAGTANATIADRLGR